MRHCLQLTVHVQTRRVRHRPVIERVQTAQRETQVGRGHDLVMVLPRSGKVRLGHDGSRHVTSSQGVMHGQ